MPGLPVPPQQTAQNLWQLSIMFNELNPLMPLMVANNMPQIATMQGLYPGSPTSQGM